MAEVAGLVIGAVALVGLFSTVVEFYDLASRAKSKDHDFSFLCQRLGDQKARFEACGKSLHLDKRRPCECCPIVSKKEDAEIAETLQMIYEHFQEGVKIEGRHASKRREIEGGGIRSRRNFWRNRSHGAIPGQWVMKDREQFERVVDELERLVISLEMASERVKFKRLRHMKRRTRHLLGLGRGKRSDQMSGIGSARRQGLEAYARVKEIGR
ncbi:MAG: hypothetical protein HETSPECPRED_003344 [Heterodermia speciosa]|uniref:Prion-inhibition and propagation HeLo domain-containing protein n=1 Tax=Heterodermia speciosa TaxID=116794 RepID=A0A8H3I5H3_9LECA|nr:MAG: hypothetical protein HETSPECPRED_003344 [Heterodermia speciosa]